MTAAFGLLTIFLPQLNQLGVFTLLVTVLSLDFLEISRDGGTIRRRFFAPPAIQQPRQRSAKLLKKNYLGFKTP